MELISYDKKYWDNYYKLYSDKNNINSMFSEFVYNNYIKKYNDVNIVLKIFDIGCGNLRDSIYFSKHNYVYACDQSIDVKNEYNNICILQDNICDVLKNNKVQTIFDIIYMRWFLHAVDYNTGSEIFSMCVNNLKMNGLICIEVRSNNDDELKMNSAFNSDDGSYEQNHKRWLYTIEKLNKLCNDNDMEILYLNESNEYSINDTDKPILIRLIAKKKLKEYYKLSPNYKHIKEVIIDDNYIRYINNDFINLTKFLDDNNIKYMAVYGTLLGLNRHGGIIPWDLDIDIGFIEEEWEKLLNINEFKIIINEESHGHINSVDCFKFTLNNEGFYTFRNSFPISINEYKTNCKQIFGNNLYIFAPIDCTEILNKRYNNNWFIVGNYNDNWYTVNDNIQPFYMHDYDRCFLI